MTATTNIARPLLAPPLMLTGLIILSWIPLVRYLPWWVMAPAVVFLAWRDRLAPRLGLPSRVVRWLLVLLVTVLIIAHFHTIMGQQPGVSFLVLLTGLKLLEAQTQRDWIVLVLLSYVALLGDLLFQPTPLMGAYTLIFLASSFVTLSVIVQPLGLTMRARWRQSAILLAQAIPLAVIAYFLFPRIAGGLWRSAPVPVGQTGLTPLLRPGSFDALLQSRRIAMRVTFDGPRPPKEDRYFRAYVLTATNGQVWQEGRPASHPGTAYGRPLYHYTVLLNPTHNRVMPALQWPLAAPPSANLVAGSLVRSHHLIRDLLRYELTAAPRYRATLDATARRRDLRLPPDLDPKIRALALRLAYRAPSANAIVQRTLNYFVAHHFIYTLTPPPMGKDPTARFLFHVRAGYCEDYAAAFATLMRAAGVPTRVVVGFLGGEFNPDGGDIMVRDWDAHSWTEVWIGGQWQRVDPTAVVAPGALQEGVAALRRHLSSRNQGGVLRRPWWSSLRHHLTLWHDAATTDWDNWVVDYNWHRQEALLRSLGLQNAGRISLIVLTLAFVLVMASVIKAIGGRRYKSPDRSLRLYERYCQKLARVGLVRRPSEGPWDYCQRAAAARPDLKNQMTEITTSYIEVRYAEKGDGLGLLRQRVRGFRPRRNPPQPDHS